LQTWAVSGPRAPLAVLALKLHDRPGVSHVTAFGNTLHVTGEDEGALERAIAPFRADAGLAWRRAEPTLEDVFIHLMPKGNGEPQ
ncbi:MAG: ABC transporter ATP-binding protein, partial [Burkholderiales bacterium]